MTSRSLPRLTLGMMLLPVLPGLGLCLARPQWAWLSVFSVLLMPAFLFGLRAARKFTGHITLSGILASEAAARAGLSWAVIFSSGVIALILSAKLVAVLGLVDQNLADDAALRWPNLLAGGYLALKGNQLPKLLKPLSELECDPATLQAFQRRIGHILILTGLADAAVWLALPTRLAVPAGAAVVTAGVLGPWLLVRVLVQRRRRQST